VLLFEGSKYSGKGIDPLVSQCRGYQGEFVVKSMDFFTEGLEVTFHLVEFEEVFIESVTHGGVLCVDHISGLA